MSSTFDDLSTLGDSIDSFFRRELAREYTCPKCQGRVTLAPNISVTTCETCGTKLQRPGSARRPAGINFDSIKRSAKSQGCRVTDLIVLAPQNDPFYVGTKSDTDKARWFAELWTRFGYSSGVHLRRVHYQIISQPKPVLMPNGLPYENTEKCWDFLAGASQVARYLGLVDPAAFVDRRNPAPTIFAEEVICAPEITVSSDLSDLGLQLPDFPERPAFYLGGFERGQAYHLELWCEKSTMNDVLIPTCQQYGANLVTGLGELSITASLNVVRRVQESGKPARIFYVSDFDPAGNCMPVSVSRKVEFFARQFGGVDIQLFPLVLTTEQVENYELPRTPIKEGEKRRGSFEDRYGEGATELDALQALHPGALSDIISEAFGHYFDEDLSSEVEEAREQVSEVAARRQETVYSRHAEELESLEAEYQSLRAEFETRMASHNARLAALWGEMAAELEAEAPEVSTADVPKPGRGTAFGAPLYDSRRGYDEQLKAYKVFQGKW